jgi:hypothetical protein
MLLPTVGYLNRMIDSSRHMVSTAFCALTVSLLGQDTNFFYQPVRTATQLSTYVRPPASLTRRWTVQMINDKTVVSSPTES